jgi:putative transcriptional regulator
MSINHHPTVENLAELAAGRLDFGRTIVVSAHLETCADCRAQRVAMEAVGGILLSDAVPEPMEVDALAHALAAIDVVLQDADTDKDAAAVRAEPSDERSYLPQSIRFLPKSNWQWIGPGIHRQLVELPHDDGARVFLLKAAPGTRMPEHTHTGTELTLVLTGAFSHAGGRYGPGDFEEADDTVDHQPIVEAGETCICLVAMQGSLKLKGGFGRLLQPFIRI